MSFQESDPLRRLPSWALVSAKTDKFAEMISKNVLDDEDSKDQVKAFMKVICAKPAKEAGKIRDTTRFPSSTISVIT